MVRYDKIKNQFLSIVLTGQKGGTGKTTIAALLTEHLIKHGKRVSLIDTDPAQGLTNWITNCQEKGRLVSQIPADCQITDVAGVSGSSLLYLKQADIILVPFIAHYLDLQVIIPWFLNLSDQQQKKVCFLPNRWQNTKEQREGLELLKQDTIRYNNLILTPLPHRPALFSSFLNGNQKNFFTNPKNRPLEKPFSELFKHYESN